jgi:hypothetical protein
MEELTVSAMVERWVVRLEVSSVVWKAGDWADAMVDAKAS